MCWILSKNPSSTPICLTPSTPLRGSLARRRLSLSIADNKKTVHLYYDEIFYIESVGHYLEFHTKDTVYRSRSSLSQLETSLTPGIFSRAHKGFLVNLEHVRAVNAADITLRDKDMRAFPSAKNIRQISVRPGSDTSKGRPGYERLRTVQCDLSICRRRNVFSAL